MLWGGMEVPRMKLLTCLSKNFLFDCYCGHKGVCIAALPARVCQLAFLYLILILCQRLPLFTSQVRSIVHVLSLRSTTLPRTIFVSPSHISTQIEAWQQYICIAIIIHSLIITHKRHCLLYAIHLWRWHALDSRTPTTDVKLGAC